MINFKEVFDKCVDRILMEPPMLRDIFLLMAKEASRTTLEIRDLSLSYISSKLAGAPHRQTIKRAIDKLIKMGVLYQSDTCNGYSLIPIINISRNNEISEEIYPIISNSSDTPPSGIDSTLIPSSVTAFVTEITKKCDSYPQDNSFIQEQNNVNSPLNVLQKNQKSVTAFVTEKGDKSIKNTKLLILGELSNYSKNILTSKNQLHRMNYRSADSIHYIKHINIYTLLCIVSYITINKTNSNIANSFKSTLSDKKSEEGSESFQKFWVAYPKKSARRKARIRWNSQNLDKKLTAILEDIQYRISSGEWRDRQFIPMPTTYLYQERWDDERLPLASVAPQPKFVEDQPESLPCQYSGKQELLIASLCEKEVSASFASGSVRTWGEVLCPWHDLYVKSLANPNGLEAMKVHQMLATASKQMWLSDLETP